MPVHSAVAAFTGPAGKLPPRAALVARGPVLRAELRVGSVLARNLAEAGREIPTAIQGELLVDTGASMTSINEPFLRALRLQRRGALGVLTSSGSHVQNVYACGLAFPGTGMPDVSETLVLGANLGAHGLMGLIGRDLLDSALFVYNGSAGAWNWAM